MSKKVISLDLWNTLIKISPSNTGFLTRFLSSNSDLEEQAIVEVVKKTRHYFDNRAITKGREIPSAAKLSALIVNSKAKLKAGELEEAIYGDLLTNPPLLIEPEELHKLAEHLSKKNIGFVISSNSGFVPSKIMREVIDIIGITSLPAYIDSYFSEEIGFAKPSEKFFEEITKQHKLLMHIGNHPIADYKIVDVKSFLYDPRNMHAKSARHRINSLSEVIKLV